VGVEMLLTPSIPNSRYGIVDLNQTSQNKRLGS
jgi:hypothetical protein